MKSGDICVGPEAEVCPMVDEVLAQHLGMAACAHCLVPYIHCLEEQVVSLSGSTMELEAERDRHKSESEFLASVCAGLIGNIYEKDKKISEQRRIIRYDEVTGTLSRDAFVEDLAKAFDRANAWGQDRKVRMAIVDLDSFKQANDTYGHTYGDKLLAFSGAVLQQAVRNFGTVYRVGGDEFAIIFDRVKAMHGQPEVIMRQSCEFLERTLAAQYQSNEELYRPELLFGASIGMARSEPSEKPDELVKRADAAMYVRKHERRAALEQFADAMGYIVDTK